MAEPNIHQIEESLRKANKRSWVRFYIFLGFILALWVATYIITEGEFSLVKYQVQYKEVTSKKQDAQILSMDSSIKARDTIITSLEEEVKILKAKLASKGVIVERTPERTAELAKLKDKLRKQEQEQKYQDSIIRWRKRQYEQNTIEPKNMYNQDMRQQQQMTK